MVRLDRNPTAAGLVHRRGGFTDQLGNYRAYSLFHVGGRYQLTDSISLSAAIYDLLDKDFIDYRPYVSDTTTGALAYANMYANGEDSRRLWLSANVSF